MTKASVVANLRAEIDELEDKFKRYQELLDQLKSRRSTLLASLDDSSSIDKKIRRITKIEKEIERLTKELIPTIREKLLLKMSETSQSSSYRGYAAC